MVGIHIAGYELLSDVDLCNMLGLSPTIRVDIAELRRRVQRLSLLLHTDHASLHQVPYNMFQLNRLREFFRDGTLIESQAVDGFYQEAQARHQTRWNPFGAKHRNDNAVGAGVLARDDPHLLRPIPRANVTAGAGAAGTRQAPRPPKSSKGPVIDLTNDGDRPVGDPLPEFAARERRPYGAGTRDAWNPGKRKRSSENEYDPDFPPTGGHQNKR
ncbi:hypothetical protein LTR37_016270 [Vermiconidia calcicola]|uniref:Uncharacterized protein n=1 Tax=Vermiconidia calcicola TaxID=1690605 RepID=A0ACC3MNX2_9PEZI|nr:hypothetical protein LTR37_016270 [Vermiconidia calcicola]